MAEVCARVVEWLSDDFPGWVRVELTDADGCVFTIDDKVPVLLAKHLDETTPLPKDVWLDCDAEAEGDRVRVTLRHDVETEQGVRAFLVTQDRVR